MMMMVCSVTLIACESGGTLTFGGPLADFGRAVAVDGQGNLSLAGSFGGDADFGEDTLSSAGHWDIFLVRGDEGGDRRFLRRFGGAGFDWGQGVAIGADGGVFISGGFSGTVDFGGGNLESNGHSDVFLAAYTADGEHRWSRGIGGPGAEPQMIHQEEGSSVALDSAGNLYMTGVFWQSADFGAGTVHTAGSAEAFVSSYTAAGKHRWTRTFGGGSLAAAKAVAVAPSGQVFVGGEFFKSIKVGEETLIQVGWSPDLFMASLSSKGDLLWAKHIKSDSYAYPELNGVAADREGNVCVTGNVYSDKLEFDKVTLAATGSDAYVLCFTSSGAHRWSRRFNNRDGDSCGNAVAMDADGNVYLTGDFEQSIDLGGGPLHSAGKLDIFVASFTPAGSHRWSRRYGGSDYDGGTAVAVGALVNVAGYFRETVDFEGETVESAGDADIFLLQLPLDP
jgi:hypothetical protein